MHAGVCYNITGAARVQGRKLVRSALVGRHGCHNYYFVQLRDRGIEYLRIVNNYSLKPPPPLKSQQLVFRGSYEISNRINNDYLHYRPIRVTVAWMNEN